MKAPFVSTAIALLSVVLAPAASAAETGASNGAPPAAAAAASGSLTPEQQVNIKRAAQILRAFTIAFQGENVQVPVKGQLLTCLYNNKLSTISTAAGEVLANNPSLDADSMADVYRAAAAVCGVVFRKVADTPDGAAAEPPAAGNSEGR